MKTPETLSIHGGKKNRKTSDAKAVTGTGDSSGRRHHPRQTPPNLIPFFYPAIYG